MFQSQPNRHISSHSKKICTGGAEMCRCSGRMWQKTSQDEKKNFVCESVERHILPRNVTNVTRHIFCHRKKWQMWRHSPKSETGSWEQIRVRPTLRNKFVRAHKTVWARKSGESLWNPQRPSRARSSHVLKKLFSNLPHTLQIGWHKNLEIISKNFPFYTSKV